MASDTVPRAGLMFCKEKRGMGNDIVQGVVTIIFLKSMQLLQRNCLSKSNATYWLLGGTSY